MWVPDSKLSGYQSYEIALPNGKLAAGEPEGSLRAVLVRRNPPQCRRAVLYVHGWSDYFFQTHLADFFARLGFDFYALDLRRYGRSLVDGQYAGFITDLSEYYQELDAAVELIQKDHVSVSLMGHSAGGLTSILYANDRPGTLDAVMLNSPWLEIQASPMLRTLIKPFLATLSSGNPIYPITISDNGFNQRMIHVSEEGQWDYDKNLKGDKAFKVRLGWFNAFLTGHARVAAGLEVDCPILVMTSKYHDFSRTWSDKLRGTDVVLAVDQIAARAIDLGDIVTLVRVQGAMHDMVLSDEPARTKVFDQLKTWICGYLPVTS